MRGCRSPRGRPGASACADGTFGPGGKLPVNLSGGALANNPVYCTGLMRIAEVAQQVRGRAGAHQKQGVATGLAHAGERVRDAVQYGRRAAKRRQRGIRA